MKFPVLYSALLAMDLGLSPVQAKAAPSCFTNMRERLQALLRRGGTEDPAVIPSEDLAVWRDALDPGKTLPWSPELDRNPLYFWWTYERLPLEIRSNLSTVPSDPARSAAYFDTIRRQLGPKYLFKTFLNAIEAHWKRELEHSALIPSYPDWVERNTRLLGEEIKHDSKIPLSFERRLSEKIAADTAFDEWTRWGVVELPVEDLGGGRIAVRLGGQRWIGIRRNGGILLNVPRSQVRHPAWNPLDESYGLKIAQSGSRPPGTYPAFVGHDGFFYLTDKNHRFWAKAGKSVRVEISDPPRTATFREFLDAAGISQPGYADIERFMAGDRKIERFIPKDSGSPIIIYPAR